MDLRCLDLGCISLTDDKKVPNSSTDTFSSTVINGKNKSPKGSPPSCGNALTRVTSQIKKPTHRKTSPLNWFPRKKVDSYMKRKIKLLQEAGGMYDTLDETLGHSNPHYCRVEREKRAAREAACKVMEARKAAMVEASWCRILQAARIPNKEADAQLIKAEKEVAEAFEAAKAKGVIMYDTPDRPWKDFEIEVSSANVKGSTTHTVRASFETAFEVDKQVAAAVKTAFIRLAHCHSFNKDEFKDLLRKISENPDSQELSESDDTVLDLTIGSRDDGSNSQKRNRKKQSPQKFEGTKLVNMMLERLKCLKEEELASLATIVATCGLNAALADTRNSKMQDNVAASSVDYLNGTRQKQVEPELPSLDKFLIKKMTKLEKEVLEAKNARKAEFERDDNVIDDEQISDDNMQERVKRSSGMDRATQNSVEPELPSLDKFLIKKMTKLEKEIFDAKNARKVEFERESHVKQCDKQVSIENVPDLGSVLVKHSSKLEKEINEAKRSHNLSENEGCPRRSLKHGKSRQLQQEDTEAPSLDKFLVKHVSKLEKEVLEAKKKQKENIDSNTASPLQLEQNYSSKEDENVEHESLDGIPEKNVSKVEGKPEVGSKEVLQVKKRDKAHQQIDASAGGLDQILVKHKSRLERERAQFASEQPEEKNTYTKSRREAHEQMDASAGGLDQILVKHKSRLERERAQFASVQPEEKNTYTKSRREAREKELLQVWGGIGLGNSMRPHVSRLERDKAAWIKAEEEEKQAAVEEC